MRDLIAFSANDTKISQQLNKKILVAVLEGLNYALGIKICSKVLPKVFCSIRVNYYSCALLLLLNTRTQAKPATVEQDLVLLFLSHNQLE